MLESIKIMLHLTYSPSDHFACRYSHMCDAAFTDMKRFVFTDCGMTASSIPLTLVWFWD